MRILWIKSGLLHPADYGGRIRSYHTLRYLARRHDVTYLALDDPPTTPAERAGAQEYSRRLLLVPHRKAPAFSAGFLLDLARNLGSPRPYFVMAYESRPMRAAIERAVAEGGYDLVVCDFLAASVNLPPNLPCPILLFAHNVEATIWGRLAETEPHPLKRAYLRGQWRKTRAFERAACRRFDLIVTVSPEDSRRLAREYGATALTDVPTGVDLTHFVPGDPARVRPRHLVFTGAMDWLPNHEAMLHFIREILPLVRRALPDVTLSVVGRHPLPELLRLCRAQAGVELTGRVPDVLPWLETAAAVVVPLRVGGGTRLKILEALAMAKPIVSSHVGAEGLPLADGRELLLADTPATFAAAVVRVLTDPELAGGLATRGAALARRHGWDTVGAAFEEICYRVSGAARPPGEADGGPRTTQPE